MGSLIGLLVGKQIFGRTITEGAARWIVSAGLFLAVMLALLAVWTMVKHDIIKGEQQKQIARAAPATQQAATERARDTVSNAKAEQEMHNAIAAQPDQPIAPTSRALACERLRRAGVHSPAC